MLPGVVLWPPDRFRAGRNEHRDAPPAPARLTAELVRRDADPCVLRLCGELSRDSVGSAADAVSKGLVLSIVGGRASARPSDPDDLSGRDRFGERGNRAPDHLSAQPAPPVWRRLDPGAADHPGWMRAGWRVPTRIRHARRADERDDQGR